MTVSLRPLTPADWPEVAEIYGQGIATGDATFEVDVPSWESWNESRLPGCRIVAVGEDGSIDGFAAVSPVSKRPAYSGVAEVMVYVREEVRGEGIGGALLTALVGCTEEAGIWTLTAGIFPENAASVRLHERRGFRIVGRREGLGRTVAGVWRDVLLLERRSLEVGRDPGPPHPED
ncbi:MAG: GNAT family N-acetyltransferase [Gemmatimonadota bacterium]|nr:GNAT family N-acetyltransferase [Gemmatimonadota bacterium]